MKIVVIGGTGLIGSRIVAKLQARGEDVSAASLGSGIDTITGEGLAEALAGTETVIDASNAPDWDDGPVLEFFRASSRRLVEAAASAGVEHYVAMSIVGADRLPDSGYLRAKVAQEAVVRGGSVPFTIARATQVFEFFGYLADSTTADGSTAHVPPVLFQPAAAAETAALVAEVAVGEPANGVVEVAGPEPLRFDQALASFLAGMGDPRRVIADPHARYFGSELDTESLTPGTRALLTATHFDDWLARVSMPAVAAGLARRLD